MKAIILSAIFLFIVIGIVYANIVIDSNAIIDSNVIFGEPEEPGVAYYLKIDDNYYLKIDSTNYLRIQ